MCGILDIVDLNKGGFAQWGEELNNSLGLMNHRRPDHSGVLHGEGYISSHRRLGVLDLSANGHQSMKSEQSGNVICYNGEVYNYFNTCFLLWKYMNFMIWCRLNRVRLK